MTQYNTLNLKLSNLQLSKLIRNKKGTEVTTKISSNVAGDLMMKIILHISYY